MIHVEITNLIISKGAYSWLHGLDAACWIDNLELVNLMICKMEANDVYPIASEGVSLMVGPSLWISCQRGSTEIVNLLISKGENEWSCGLGGACEGGNIEIIKLMMSKGATKCEYCGVDHGFDYWYDLMYTTIKCINGYKFVIIIISN